MSAKHTPGPWKLSAGRTIETVNGEFYISYGYDRAKNPLFRNFVELDNNARLIAAAPELLAELKTAQNAIRRALPFLPADSEAVHAGECLDAIAAVIDKATGN